MATQQHGADERVRHDGEDDNAPLLQIHTTGKLRGPPTGDVEYLSTANVHVEHSHPGRMPRTYALGPNPNPKL